MSAMLLEERRVDPAAYAIGARAPRRAVRPASPDEVAETLRAASRDGLSVVPWGGGVGLVFEPAPERYDLALDLTALDRIVEYEPEDFTLTASCGATLARLRSTLAERGQELPLEAAGADRATLGGVLAANASGARRLRFGAPRDRILGARFILADGTPARAGGKVVKNVAGYGIHRLLCGSRGGLAVLVEASLKVAPASEQRVALVYRAREKEIAARARWAFLPRLEPAALTLLGAEATARVPALARSVSSNAGDALTVIVGLEEDAVWVEQQYERTVTALGTPIAQLEGEGVATLWQELADLEHLRAERLSFAAADNSPAALAPILDSPESTALVFHALCGRLHLFPEPARAQPVVNQLAERSFTLIDASGLGDVEPAVPPQSAVRALRARIRAALDPGSGLALGERWASGMPSA